MRAVFESLFSAAYLVIIFMLGISTLRRIKPRQQGALRPVEARERLGQYRLFGVMVLILGGGDAFHLFPRILANIGLHIPAALGFGTLVSSVTMTVFYLLLYYYIRQRYGVWGRGGLTLLICALAVMRVALCLFPQNAWFGADSPVSWGIYRNIPFVLMGAALIAFFYQASRERRDRAFRNLWLAVLLSFVFYIPVVLFARTDPLVGLLMIPKTLMYLWIVWMGTK